MAKDKQKKIKEDGVSPANKGREHPKTPKEKKMNGVVHKETSAASPTTSSPAPAKRKTSDEGGVDDSIGFSSTGSQFKIPTTLDTIKMFLPPNISLGSGTALLFCLFFIYLAFFAGLPRWVHVCIYFFWRSAYDIGLGIILSNQSKHRSFTKKYIQWTKDPKSWRCKLLHHLAQGAVKGGKYKVEEYPPEFTAWLIFKHLVNLILINDTCNYLLLGYKSFSYPKELTFAVIAQYCVGVFLCVFNYWAKVDAHRCIGEYCWYWGDFFYAKQFNLKFDGIFELFPHPMYTVGYSLYYGYTLIVRSHTMLFVSLGAHAMQLAFLMLVEEPHIKRTYPVEEQFDANKYRQLYDAKNGLFPQRRDTIFLLRLDVFNAGDVALVAVVLYSVFFSLIVKDKWLLIVQVVAWRLFHWVGLGALLYAQSNFKWWTKMYQSRGRSLHEAFAQWKTVYNLSMTVNAVVFILCSFRFWNTTDALSPLALSLFVTGFVLVLLTIWTLHSTYQAVGDFGWFFGDFFIERDAFEHHLCYTGIYRFLNNPEAVTGYAGLYGMALISRSFTVFALAALSHILNLMFIDLVEIPHMRKLYGEVRSHDPIRRTLRSISNKILEPVPDKVKEAQKQLEDNFKQEVRKIREKAVDEVKGLYFRLKEIQESNRRGSEQTKMKFEERVTLGSPLVVNFTTRPGHSEYDWIGVYEVDRPSSPGMSDGAWMYVGVKSGSGEVTLPASVLPKREGVYEVRYHLDNQYTVVARGALLLERDPSSRAASPFSPPR